ncbi:hypothetical protein BC826DRAFT_1103154 [Russula brevipes]|nr:hypothetical protein BC826DRAFT_1103154 [Russula brevipes]
MKHHQSDEEAHSRSDASSHGMGNVADIEMDVSPNGALGAENTRQVREKHSDGTQPPLPPPPAKKKRTRTLTTPHQSAVLHALLAQSRFPTTAMREEVGRSIGLSARKVQVWFQNQRQKARRPRNQGSAPPARPPQYGAFPNASALSSAHSTLIPSNLPSSDETTRPPFYAAPPSAPFIQFSPIPTRSAPAPHAAPPSWQLRQTSVPQSAFAPESRPQTPGSSFLVPRRRLDSARDLPRLQIPPLHVPDSPPPTYAHAQQQHHKQQQQQQQQRSTARYSFSPPQFPARSFSHPPSERALPSATSCSCASSRGESSPAPSSRTRRFDPVRDAASTSASASERSGSQGTDASTPPYIIDTPHA